MNRPHDDQPTSGSAGRQIVGGLLGGVLVLATVIGSIILATQEAPPPTPTLAVFISSSATPASTFPTPPASTTAVPSPSPVITTPTQPTIQPTAACVIPSGWTAYTVRAGDTLSSIAAALGTNAFNLIEGNCLAQTDLVAGQIIYVPPLPTRGPTPVPTPCGPPSNWVIYKVQPGDTLYSLSVRYKTTVYALALANCLGTYTLRVGQPLYVPPLAATATPSPTFTAAPSFTPTPTPTQIPTDTPTPTETFTPGPTDTPTPLPTDTPIPSWTPQPTDTTSPTSTPTATPQLTETPAP